MESKVKEAEGRAEGREEEKAELIEGIGERGYIGEEEKKTIKN